ncbi:hypothetical protein ACQJBY_013860 [Aegilops geniculata]
MAAAAGGPLGSVFTFFLPKIWSAFWQKQKLEIEVKSLKDELVHVRGIIQDCRLRGSDLGGTLNIAKLRQMANEIEDCIDSCQIAKTLKTRADLIRMIPDLKGRSKKLGEDYKDQQKSVSSSTGEKSTTSRHQGGSGGSGASGHGQSFSGGDFGVLKPSCTDPVDMDGPIKELLELVKRSDGDPESKKLKVISISGFGGLGKTLLADQVYFHKDCAQPHFTVRARVDAAGKSHDEVLEEILEQVLRTSKNDAKIQHNGELSHGRAPQSKVPYPRNKSVNDKGKQVTRQNGELDHGRATQCLIERLRSYLKNERFLILIVDMQIWTDIASVLEGIGELHSRVIITTTIQSIATKWASPKNHLYPMSTLNEVYSAELFFKEFNGGECKKPDKGELHSSKLLLDKCEGLPLALISTAKILSGRILDNKACSEAWKKLCGTKHDETSMLQKMQLVLANTCAGLSGTNITPALMDCLLYFSMFPPNHHVRKNSLMRRLLAEGMEQNCAGKKINVEELIHRLIDRSIIQSMEVSTGGDVKRCKASSLMYEYIFHRSMSEEFMAVFSDLMDNGFNEEGYVRRLSIHATETGIGKAKLPDDLSHLHTLAVFDTKKPEATRDLANYLFGGKGLLAKHKVLRVLDLKECAGLDEKHLQTICDLLLLKYLSLGDSIVRVPRKIAQLKLLETLDLSRTKVVTVYIEVLGLPKLIHLLGKVRLSTRDSVSGVEKRKKFLANKCKLDTLAGFITGRSEAFPQMIGHMRKLNKVKIWINSTADRRNLEHLTEGIKEFVRNDRYESEAGRSLSIDFSGYLERSLHFLNLQGPHADEMKVITNIQGNAQGAHREQQEDSKECISSDGGSGSNQIKNMPDNNQEYQTEEVDEIVDTQDNAQEVVGEIVEIQENTQGAQIHQEEEAKQCLGSEGASTSNQIKNIPENNQDHQTQEKKEAKQGPDYDVANSTEHDERPGKLTSLKLGGKLTKFPVQFVTQMTGIQRLCLSSTGLSGEEIVDALSVLPSLIYLKLREHDLRHLNIQNKQFPSLRSVCFSVKDGNLPCPTIIQQFCNLHEVYLHANLDYEARRRWKEASESHPGRPRIFFAESKYEGTSSGAVTQNQ